MRIVVLTRDCTGPNERCVRDARDGRRVHMYAQLENGSLVLPTYHFESEESGREQIQSAYDNAAVIDSDAELYDARARGVAYKLHGDWLDPSRR
ncbi:hypothetical protein NC315_13570 [Streptomyces sp. G2]|uniref:hypothetical protein n=1 Tax=Streptomyces sp. G2 TaxID=1684471 RepID=UPI0020308968|nr:hypothetical protein [Streptomyces sp. G2]MCM1946399.1 hypothetical protein [Streptomyces sp. G2]